VRSLAAVSILWIACTPDHPVSAPTIEVPAQPAQIDGGAVLVAPRDGPLAQERPLSGDTNIVGRWQGVGTQDDGQSWPIVVDLFAIRTGVCAHVEYPSIPCRADWVCTGARNGEVDAREKLLDDSVTRCVDNGTMTMRHDTAKDELVWEWEGSGQSASGRLHRMP
jgi:hypothetical protein